MAKFSIWTLTVVSGGIVCCDAIKSLNPIMLISSGTFILHSYKALKAPVAIVSVSTKKAVGSLSLFYINSFVLLYPSIEVTSIVSII